MTGALPERFEEGLVAELDEPVRRYFTHAIADSTPLAPRVRLRMTGRIKVGRWLAFSAEQELDGRSFEWRAAAEVHEERRFGGITIPSAFTVGWWFDTPRYAPFFEARIVDAVVVA